MAIERDGDILEFQCDGKPRCGEALSFHGEDFYDALPQVTAAGWTILKKGDDWLHYCADHKQQYKNEVAKTLSKLSEK